jgi:ferredoxin-NADP reductase
VVLVLQLFGGLIVGAALLQAGVGLVAQVNGAFRRWRLDQRKLAAFTAQTDIQIRRAEVARRRSELTWSGKRKFRVVKRQIENKASDICSFYLEPHDGGALPPFLPGQFLTFELNIPDHPVPVVRCYSLSGSPLMRDRYRVSIKRLGPPPKAGPEIPGGLSSNFFHGNIKEGDIVDVAAPNGGFHLDTNSERPVVLIAGGVGLTPVLSMLKWLSDTGSNREAWFFYAVRNSADIALRDEIRDIVEGNKSRFHSVILYSAPTDQCVRGKDYDVSGYPGVEVFKRYLKTSNYEFYICGPPPMMESIVKQLLDWGVPEPDIHFEAFGPASVKGVKKAEGADDPAGAGAGPGVNVEFTRSGKSFVWTKAVGTILELADANGVRISSGCRAGNCGTCVTALKRGKVAYITKPASSPAQGSALVCIAHPDGDIALDA